MQISPEKDKVVDILEHLKADILNSNLGDLPEGICQHLEDELDSLHQIDYFDIIRHEIHDIYLTWDKCVCETYPVPPTDQLILEGWNHSTYTFRQARDQFDLNTSDVINFWTGEQGKLRLELIDHCLKELESI